MNNAPKTDARTRSDAITSFSGPHRFLSNFYLSPIVYEGAKYATVEHAFQAAKTDSVLLKDLISKSASPGEAKRRGRRVELRADWEDVKVSVVEALLRLKFEHPELRDKLLATGERDLVEGNTWGDREWGVCQGVGKNLLGKLLMKVRADLRKTAV